MGSRRLSSPPAVRGKHGRFRSVLLLAAAAFLLSVSIWPLVDDRLPRNRHEEDNSDDLFLNEEETFSHLGGGSADPDEKMKVHEDEEEKEEGEAEARGEKRGVEGPAGSCATVEKMGEAFAGGFEKESLRVREVIRRHFNLNGASKMELLESEICHHHSFAGRVL